MNLHLRPNECFRSKVLKNVTSQRVNAQMKISHFSYTLGNYIKMTIEQERRINFVYLYRDTQSYKLDVASPDTIKRAAFVKDRPLVVLIHGYTGHKDFSPSTELRPGKHVIRFKWKHFL